MLDQKNFGAKSIFIDLALYGFCGFGQFE